MLELEREMLPGSHAGVAETAEFNLDIDAEDYSCWVSGVGPVRAFDDWRQDSE